MGVLDYISQYFSFFVGSLKATLSSWGYTSFIVIFFALSLCLFSIFIWYFYNTLSKKDLLDLNLEQYNKSEKPGIYKFFTVVFYIIENIILMPFFIALWFFGLSIFLALLSEGKTLDTVLLITASIVISVRMLSYFNEPLAADLAKLFPFIALSVFLVSTSSLNFDILIVQISSLDGLINQALTFLGIIFVVEIVLRLFYTFGVYIKSG